MLRVIVTLLAGILLITLLRAVIGVVVKAAASLFPAQPPPSSGARAGQTPASGSGGELKPCASCGTFVPAATSLKRVIEGATLHFCSVECRQKARTG